jgi:hypothetical protein
MFSQNNIEVKIEQKNGSFLTYNLIDIKEINFQDSSLSSVCTIFMQNDSIFSTQNYKIVSMAVKNGINNIDSLSIHYYWNLRTNGYYNIPLKVIDSISFLNTNEIFGKVFSNIKLEINGLNAVYDNTVYRNPPGKFEGSNDTTKFNKIIDLKNNYWTIWNPYGWGCEKRFSQNIIGDLNYCNADESYKYTHNTCGFSKCYLFIDTLKMIIDSLFYINKGKDYSPAQTGGGYRDELDYSQSLILYSVPFTLLNDNTIVVNYTIDDLSKIKYKYDSEHVVGSSQSYTQTITSFLNFLSLTDSATISIVIRE